VVVGAIGIVNKDVNEGLKMLDNINLLDVSKIAVEAGHKVLEVYNTDFSVEQKEDQSPLTLADQQSHEVIVNGLNNINPEIPILSEEGDHSSFGERKEWSLLWVIDPLDGTKEFVKKNGEFTINIALVSDGKPVMGIIYAPVNEELYVASKKLGAWKLTDVKSINHKDTEDLLSAGSKVPLENNRDQTRVVASRSHLTEETEAFIAQLEKEGEVETTSAGSSLKICLVAEGSADYYPRYAPTMEWDTAAGHAILECSGGHMVEKETQTPLVYNKENLLNPWFLAKR